MCCKIAFLAMLELCFIHKLFYKVNHVKHALMLTANSVNSNQTAHKEQSDQGLHYSVNVF